MMLVLTKLTTLAAAYASPVSMSVLAVDDATLPPVEDRTMTLLVTVAIFVLITFNLLLVRQVRRVHGGAFVPGIGTLLGLEPGEPAKKKDKS